MKQAFKPKQILWVDLEMTGLDPMKDRILEVGVVVTDWNFKELATYEGIVRVDSDIINTRMVGEFWDSFPEVRTALIEQNKHGKSSVVIETELLKFINKSIGGEEKVLLAGNSIHQDRRFINQEWHKLDAKLHYRMLDVSAWKVVFEGKFKKKFAKPEAHRALDDIRGSIEELEYYLKKVKA
ncbi:MAG: oligoribonuclease [Candidatus Saccharimonas sp.]